MAARFWSQIFAVSCKLRARDVTLRRQATEVESVARTCLSRFAVPVVVRVRLNSQFLHQPVPRQGAIFFDLAAILGEDFRGRLEQAVAARRTLAS